MSNKQGMKLLLLLAAALHPQNTSKLLLWPFKSQRRTGQMFFSRPTVLFVLVLGVESFYASRILS